MEAKLTILCDMAIAVHPEQFHEVVAERGEGEATGDAHEWGFLSG
jgi:hypothetical protein